MSNHLPILLLFKDAMVKKRKKRIKVKSDSSRGMYWDVQSSCRLGNGLRCHRRFPGLCNDLRSVFLLLEREKQMSYYISNFFKNLFGNRYQEDKDYSELDVENSVVDLLKSRGQESSFQYRKELAAERGIENYRGTAEQNIRLHQELTGN